MRFKDKVLVNIPLRKSRFYHFFGKNINHLNFNIFPDQCKSLGESQTTPLLRQNFGQGRGISGKFHTDPLLPFIRPRPHESICFETAWLFKDELTSRPHETSESAH